MNSKKCKFSNSLMKQSEPRKPFFFGVLDSSLSLLHHNRINEVFEKPCQSHPFFLLFYAYVSFFDAETEPAWLLRPVFLKKVVMFFSIIDTRTSSVISMVKAKRKLKKCTMKKPNRWS